LIRSARWTLGTVTRAGGQAALSTNALALGSHVIQATYNPDSVNFLGDSDTLTQVVNATGTTTTTTSSPAAAATPIVAIPTLTA
jgi:hypothetical protein